MLMLIATANHATAATISSRSPTSTPRARRPPELAGALRTYAQSTAHVPNHQQQDLGLLWPTKDAPQEACGLQRHNPDADETETSAYDHGAENPVSAALDDIDCTRPIGDAQQGGQSPTARLRARPDAHDVKTTDGARNAQTAAGADEDHGRGYQTNDRPDQTQRGGTRTTIAPNDRKGPSVAGNRAVPEGGRQTQRTNARAAAGADERHENEYQTDDKPDEMQRGGTRATIATSDHKGPSVADNRAAPEEGRMTQRPDTETRPTDAPSATDDEDETHDQREQTHAQGRCAPRQSARRRDEGFNTEAPGHGGPARAPPTAATWEGGRTRRHGTGERRETTDTGRGECTRAAHSRPDVPPAREERLSTLAPPERGEHTDAAVTCPHATIGRSGRGTADEAHAPCTDTVDETRSGKITADGTCILGADAEDEAAYGGTIAGWTHTPNADKGVAWNGWAMAAYALALTGRHTRAAGYLAYASVLSGATAAPSKPKKQDLTAKINQIRGLIPGVSTLYAQTCLEDMNYDVNNAVEHIIMNPQPTSYASAAGAAGPSEAAHFPTGPTRRTRSKGAAGEPDDDDMTPEPAAPDGPPAGPEEGGTAGPPGEAAATGADAAGAGTETDTAGKSADNGRGTMAATQTAKDAAKAAQLAAEDAAQEKVDDSELLNYDTMDPDGPPIAELTAMDMTGGAASPLPSGPPQLHPPNPVAATIVLNAHAAGAPATAAPTEPPGGGAHHAAAASHPTAPPAGTPTHHPTAADAPATAGPTPAPTDTPLHSGDDMDEEDAEIQAAIQAAQQEQDAARQAGIDAAQALQNLVDAAAQAKRHAEQAVAAAEKALQDKLQEKAKREAAARQAAAEKAAAEARTHAEAIRAAADEALRQAEAMKQKADAAAEEAAHAARNADPGASSARQTGPPAAAHQPMGPPASTLDNPPSGWGRRNSEGASTSHDHGGHESTRPPHSPASTTSSVAAPDTKRQKMPAAPAPSAPLAPVPFPTCMGHSPEDCDYEPVHRYLQQNGYPERNMINNPFFMEGRPDGCSLVDDSGEMRSTDPMEVEDDAPNLCQSHPGAVFTLEQILFFGMTNTMTVSLFPSAEIITSTGRIRTQLRTADRHYRDIIAQWCITWMPETVGGRTRMPAMPPMPPASRVQPNTRMSVEDLMQTIRHWVHLMQLTPEDIVTAYLRALLRAKLARLGQHATFRPLMWQEDGPRDPDGSSGGGGGQSGGWPPGRRGNDGEGAARGYYGQGQTSGSGGGKSATKRGRPGGRGRVSETTRAAQIANAADPVGTERTTLSQEAPSRACGRCAAARPTDGRRPDGARHENHAEKDDQERRNDGGAALSRRADAQTHTRVVGVANTLIAMTYAMNTGSEHGSRRPQPPRGEAPQPGQSRTAPEDSGAGEGSHSRNQGYNHDAKRRTQEEWADDEEIRKRNRYSQNRKWTRGTGTEANTHALAAAQANPAVDDPRHPQGGTAAVSTDAGHATHGDDTDLSLTRANIRTLLIIGGYRPAGVDATVGRVIAEATRPGYVGNSTGVGVDEYSDWYLNDRPDATAANTATPVTAERSSDSERQPARASTQRRAPPIGTKVRAYITIERSAQMTPDRPSHVVTNHCLMFYATVMQVHHGDPDTRSEANTRITVNGTLPWGNEVEGSLPLTAVHEGSSSVPSDGSPPYAELRITYIEEEQPNRLTDSTDGRHGQQQRHEQGDHPRPGDRVIIQGGDEDGQAATVLGANTRDRWVKVKLEGKGDGPRSILHMQAHECRRVGEAHRPMPARQGRPPTPPKGPPPRDLRPPTWENDGDARAGHGEQSSTGARNATTAATFAVGDQVLVFNDACWGAPAEVLHVHDGGHTVMVKPQGSAEVLTVGTHALTDVNGAGSAYAPLRVARPVQTHQTQGPVGESAFTQDLRLHHCVDATSIAAGAATATATLVVTSFPWLASCVLPFASHSVAPPGDEFRIFPVALIKSGGTKKRHYSVPVPPIGTPIIFLEQPGLYNTHIRGIAQEGAYAKCPSRAVAVLHILQYYVRHRPPAGLCLNCYTHHPAHQCPDPTRDFQALINACAKLPPHDAAYYVSPACPNCGDRHPPTRGRCSAM